MTYSLAKKIVLPLAKDLKRLTGVQSIQTTLNNVVFHQGIILLNELKAQERYSDPNRLMKYGYAAFSMADEDGIIEEIFRRIGTNTNMFCEIGSGNGWENCTCNLLLKGWSGVWFDAGPTNVALMKEDFSTYIAAGKLEVRSDLVTTATSKEVTTQWPELKAFDLFVLDIDGNDYHVMEAMGAIKPRVVVLEYNAKFRPPIEWVMPYKEDHWWDGTHKFGASLSSYTKLMERLGYALVGCNITGANAFFVRADLVGDKFAGPFTAENHFEPARYWLAMASGHPTEIPRL